MLKGPSYAGKTVLLKILSKTSYNKSEATTLCCLRKNQVIPINEFENRKKYPKTIPTVGSNIIHIKFSHNEKVTVCEIGGRMSPVWSSYYNDYSSVIFVLDSSNSDSINNSKTLLQDIFSSEETAKSKFLIVFNKCDLLEEGVSKEDLMSSLDVQKFIQPNQIVQYVLCSALNRFGMSVIRKWLKTI